MSVSKPGGVAGGNTGGTTTASSGFVNVNDYGAKGDGVTDDTAAIRLAVAAVAASTKKGLIFCGTYRVSDTITLASEMAIYGGRSTINFTSGTKTLFDCGLNPVNVHDLNLICWPSPDPTSAVAFQFTGGNTYETLVIGPKISDCYIYGFSTPIIFDSCGFTCVDNCTFIHWTESAIWYRNTANPDYGDHSVQGSSFNGGSANHAIKHTSSGGLRVVGNKFLGTTSQIYLSETGSTADLLISANSMESASTSAIFVDASGGGFADVIIADNQITLTTGSASNIIDIQNIIYDVNICGNLIRGSQTTKTGVSFSGSAQRGLVSGNQFIDLLVGVKESGNDVDVTSNKFTNCTTKTSGVFQPQNAVPQLGRGIRFGVLGDSITADSYSGDAASSIWTNLGYAAWLRRFLGQRIDLPASRMWAVAGSTVTNVLDNQLPSAIAADFDVAIVHCGTNSVGGETNSAIISELTTIYQSLVGSGKFVIAVPIRAHGTTSAFTGDGLLQFSYINRWIANYCRNNKGMLLFDVNPIYIDFATGLASSSLLRDDLHDNQSGAVAFASALATKLSPFFPTTEDRFIHVGDVYDVAKNPTGNLITNGLLTGTAGTLLNGVTGTAPDGWFLYRGTNSGTLTVVGSSVADSNYTNLNKCRMTFGGTADYNSAYLIYEAPSFLVGDTVYAACDITPNITTANVNCIYLELIAQDSGRALLRHSFDGFTSAYGSLPSSFTTAFSLRTEPMIIPANTAHLLVQLVVGSGASGAMTATVDVERFEMRKVV